MLQVGLYILSSLLDSLFWEFADLIIKLFFKASPQRRVPISVSLRLFFLLTTDQLLVRFFISFASILDTTLGLHSCLLVGGSLMVRAVVWGAPKYIFYLQVMEVVGKIVNQLIWSRITGNKKLTLAVSKVIEGLIERSLCLRIMPVHWPDRAKNFFYHASHLYAHRWHGE